MYKIRFIESTACLVLEDGKSDDYIDADKFAHKNNVKECVIDLTEFKGGK